jgi:hypothetical protein
MNINTPNAQHRSTETGHNSLIAYMKRLGHVPTFANDEITIFSLCRPDSLHITLTISNRFDHLESFRVDCEAGILDLASLIFNVEIDQIIASPKTYGFDGFFVRGNVHE